MALRLLVAPWNKIRVATTHPAGVYGSTHACTQALLIQEGSGGKKQSTVNYDTHVLNSHQYKVSCTE